jgi:hypothetical protein
MARNSASPPCSAPEPGSQRMALRLAAAVALWLAVVGVTQGALCAELGDALQRMEDSIELRLRPSSPTAPAVHESPTRSSEPEPIEPWELVGV